MYELIITYEAKEDLLTLKRSEPLSFKKAQTLLYELKEHPETGTGKPERLKGFPNQWSRRISKKHRLVYEIDKNIITVTVVSAYRHYDDK